MKRAGASKEFIFGLLVVFLVLIFSLAVLISASGRKIRQPVDFNHAVHSENGLECIECHPYFQDHVSSGKPSLGICAGCHEEALGESQEEQKVVQHIQEGIEIEWRRLFFLPEDVYFSHRRHVAVGEIECSTCHGDIGESPSPPVRPKNLTMKRCMACHREKGADNDCIACHR